ncbi:hypothetical protein [Lacticaseibacillus suihuaensis]
MVLNPTHRYAQQATRLTQGLFVGTSLLTVVFFGLTAWRGWWWLLGVAAIVAFWGGYSLLMTTVPVRDLTTQITETVPMAAWRDFKRAHPDRVAKNGSK